MTTLKTEAELAEQIKNKLRENWRGQCKSFSLGDACPCELCATDELHYRLRSLREQEAAIKARPNIQRLREILGSFLKLTSTAESWYKEALFIIDNINTPTDKRPILGDWRDQGNAMEAAALQHPQFLSVDPKSNETFIPGLWDFCQLLLLNYTPLRYKQICSECPSDYPPYDYRKMYRCFYCKVWLCELHTESHMGVSHK